MPEGSVVTAPHGTRACWQRGCRRPECIDAARAYRRVSVREWRRRQRTGEPAPTRKAKPTVARLDRPASMCLGGLHRACLAPLCGCDCHKRPASKTRPEETA